MTQPLGVYELEPIGEHGTLEAVASHPFCSKVCRDAYMARWGQEQALERGPFEVTIDGLVCEQCAKPLPSLADSPEVRNG